MGRTKRLLYLNTVGNALKMKKIKGDTQTDSLLLFFQNKEGRLIEAKNCYVRDT
jgi:hypothetical protein